MDRKASFCPRATCVSEFDARRRAALYVVWHSLTTPAKTVVCRRSSVIDVLMPLSILEETVAVMRLAPHEHAQTDPDGLADAEDSCVTRQRQVPQSKWR